MRKNVMLRPLMAVLAAVMLSCSAVPAGASAARMTPAGNDLYVTDDFAYPALAADDYSGDTPPESGGRAALEEAIEALRTICNDQIGKTVWESADGANVSPAALWVPIGTRDYLTYDVIKPALAVAENDSAAQTEIGAATAMVANAIAAYEETVKPGTASSDVFITANGPAVTGNTLEICITMALGGKYEALSATINTTGLTYQGNSMDSLSTEHQAILFSMFAPSLTYVYLVSAPAGQSVQLELTDVNLQTSEGVNIIGEPFGWRAAVTAGGSSGITPPGLPQPVPAPEIPAVSGYQGGRLSGRVYYMKTSGASMLFYQQRSSGSMGRVSAPYVTAADGTRYYPVNCGGTVLLPRLRNGSLEAYCRYEDGMEIPVLAEQARPESAEDLQPFTLNGRQYYARTSGASMLFYQKRSNGSFGRVSAPYVTDRNGVRFYPVNCGGTILYPKLAGGLIASYCSYSLAGDIPALTVL